MDLMTRSGAWREYEFFQGLRRLDALARWATWSVAAEDDRKALARRVEAMAAERIADRGWPVQRCGANDPFDLQAGGAQIEVKAARWHAAVNGGGRYQAAIRNDQADLVVFACVGERDEVWAWFLIPASEVGARRNVAVTSPDPRAYRGQWAEYLGRWDLVDEEVEAAGPFPAQLNLFGVEGSPPPRPSPHLGEGD